MFIKIMVYVINVLMDMLLKEIIELIAMKKVNLLQDIIQKMRKLVFINAMI